MSTYIVYFTFTSFAYNEVNGLAMVFDIEPVANIFSLAIDRQFLAFQNIVYNQWNKLLREVVRPIVV